MRAASYEGYGTDVYIYLNALAGEAVEMLPVWSPTASDKVGFYQNTAICIHMFAPPLKKKVKPGPNLMNSKTELNHYENSNTFSKKFTFSWEKKFAFFKASLQFNSKLDNW